MRLDEVETEIESNSRLLRSKGSRKGILGQLRSLVSRQEITFGAVYDSITLE